MIAFTKLFFNLKKILKANNEVFNIVVFYLVYSFKFHKNRKNSQFFTKCKKFKFFYVPFVMCITHIHKRRLKFKTNRQNSNRLCWFNAKCKIQKTRIIGQTFKNSLSHFLFLDAGNIKLVELNDYAHTYINLCWDGPNVKKLSWREIK